MATIVFCVPPMTGPINAGIRLAHELRQEGHKIFYFGIADCEAFVRANGFDFITIFEQWFPKGWVEGDFRKLIACKGQDELHIAKNVVSNFNEFLDYLMADGENDYWGIINRVNPDLIIISPAEFDSLIWALLAYRFNIKTVYLCDVLGRSAGSVIPPNKTDLFSATSLRSRISVRLQWYLHGIRKKKRERYLTKMGLSLLPLKKVKQLACKFQYPYRLIDFTTDYSCPQLKLPELVLCPQSFDFPGAEKPGRYYLDASICLERKQCTFPWDKINRDRPLVYVSLSTLHYKTVEELHRFFLIVINTSTKWPGWDWVLSIGDYLAVTDFPSNAQNVVIVNRAPQLDLLERASIMIGHGGANSIKECIYFGVPMIVFPLGFDQPGNIARVEYHGLGLKGDFEKITVDGLQSLIQAIDSDTGFRERVKTMQDKFIEAENAKLGIQTIKNIILNEEEYLIARHEKTVVKPKKLYG